MSKEVDTPFAGGRWSFDQYRAFIMRALGRAWMKYPVKQDVLKSASRPVSQETKARSPRTKFEYRCAICEKWFLGSEVQVDHKQACSMDDLGRYIVHLFCEEDGLQVLCKGCHRVKTKAERAQKKRAS